MIKGYDPDAEVDIAGFAGSMTAYAALVAGIATAIRTSDVELPQSFRAADLMLGGVATHKLSRLLANGAVTSPIRAPFTEFVEPAGSSEHVEQPRSGRGPRHTIGELLTCPFCLGVWLGTAYVTGLAVAPRPTRAPRPPSSASSQSQMLCSRPTRGFASIEDE